MTFDGNYVEFDNINDYKYWYEFDTLEYGHCFTFETPPGIKFVRMKLHTMSQLTFHTPGILLIRNDGGQKRQDLASIALNKKGYISIDIDYEYHQLLDVDYGGFPCYKYKEYRKDYCHEQFVEKEMLDKVGCLPPSGLNKSQICKQYEDSAKVSQIYWDYYTGGETNDRCYNPCSIFSFIPLHPKMLDEVSNVNFNGSIYMTFPRYVKVFERSYTYSQLSLVAEVGGYVGLFLGISINQVTNLVAFLLKMIKRILQILGQYY